MLIATKSRLPICVFLVTPRKPINLTIPQANSIRHVRLLPRRDYDARIMYLGLSRDIVPTAILRFQSRDVCDECVGDFCAALSLIQGRKITWIHHARYSKQQFRHAVFGQTITKPYTAQALCFNPKSRTAVQLPIDEAVIALPAITAFRKKFDPRDRIINAWLDARVETDYLEARTLKYVVVIEALNAITIQAEPAIPRTVVESKIRRDLHRTVLAGIPSDSAVARKVLTLENWQRINYSSFRSTFIAVCDLHFIRVLASDLKLFTRIRNDAVHRLTHDLSIPLPDEWTIPEQPQAAIHFFAAAFVDSVILQLFGLGAHLTQSAEPDSTHS